MRGHRRARPALAIAAALVPLAVAAAERLEPTAPTHTGPWYEPGAPEVESLWREGDPGRRLDLRGRVLDTGARPIAGARIEYWHTDAAGNYPPLRASTRSARDGSFVIRTVLPGHHLGYRARHIHFVIAHPDHERLVTRIYFRGDENMDEAPWPELAITLEEGMVGTDPRLFGNVELVLR